MVEKIFRHSKPSVTLNISAHCISDLRYTAAIIIEEIATPVVFILEKF